MLSSLEIKNYALIEHIEISFDKGFSTITGETGAGKSIMLGAISLLLGQRADTTVVREPDQKSIIEAEWDIEAYNLHGLFDEYDVDWQAKTLIRREILPNGKSRAFVNDTPVTLPFLKELGVRLVDIHSQHQNLLLQTEEFQLEVIDAVANNSNLLNECQAIYSSYIEIKTELKSLRQKSQQALADLDYKRFLYHELTDAKLKDGELQEIENELGLYNNAEDIIIKLGGAVEELSMNEGNLLARLKAVSDSLKTIASHNDILKGLSERLESTYIELDDINIDLNRFQETIEFDPERNQYLNDRVDLIYSLQKKHKVRDEKALIEIAGQLGAELELADNYDDIINEKEKKIAEIEIILDDLSTKLSDTRKKTAGGLCDRLKQMLEMLGMPNASIEIAFETTDYSSTGTDRVNFLFAANKSGRLLPISQVASGGEISRVMLCLKYFMSESKQMPTIIFDEIDTGVSGEIAYSMGQLMEKIAKNIQILSITHLPQIAALGNNQYKVYKYDTEDQTITGIKHLDENERIYEIASMMSGDNLTDAAIANARALMKL